MTVNDELVRVWKEIAITYFNIGLSDHYFPGEKHEKPNIIASIATEIQNRYLPETNTECNHYTPNWSLRWTELYSTLIQ